MCAANKPLKLSCIIEAQVWVPKTQTIIAVLLMLAYHTEEALLIAYQVIVCDQLLYIIAM